MKRLLAPVGSLSAGTLLLAAAVVLTQAHIRGLREMRDVSIPLAGTLVPLEERLDLLHKQIELAEVQAQMRTGTAEEQLHTYVLPMGTDLQRVLSFFDVTRILLERDGMLRGMSAIDVGEPAPVQDAPAGSTALHARSLSFSGTFSDEGLERLLSLVELSGLLTVGDALSPEQVDRLFSLTESENYAGIVQVEKFLSTDLFAYIQEPTPHEEQVLRALSSERFLQEFRSLIQTSRLGGAQRLLGGAWGQTFRKQRLWPMQFLTLERLDSEKLGEGWQNVAVTMKVYGRE